MSKKTRTDVEKKAVKTPLENAMYKIQAAYIAAFISAGVTLVFTVIALSGHSLINGINPFMFIDVVCIVLLGILLLTLKSRVAAVILFIYFLFSKVTLYMDNPGSIGSSMYMTVIFCIAYFNGILGTFAYQKIKKEGGLLAEQGNTSSDQSETTPQA